MKFTTFVFWEYCFALEGSQQQRQQGKITNYDVEEKEMKSLLLQKHIRDGDRRASTARSGGV